MVIVLKGNGEREEFNRNKAILSCIRAGAPRQIAEEIVSKVERRLYNGIPTKKIMRMIREELKRTHFPSFIRYPLKDAIASLNPELHEFEYYVANLFRYFGFKARRSPEPFPRGLCVENEIDVVIEKENIVGLVECKHHYRESTFTGLDPVMKQYARLNDIQDGYKKGIKNAINANMAVVVTNTAFSNHAIDFGNCRNVKLIAWKYSNFLGTLRDIIEEHKAYPLTLFGLNIKERERLLHLNIFDSNDFYNTDEHKILRTGIPLPRIRNIKENIKKVINNQAEVVVDEKKF